MEIGLPIVSLNHGPDLPQIQVCSTALFSEITLWDFRRKSMETLSLG